jgi:aquaporin Z
MPKKATPPPPPPPAAETLPSINDDMWAADESAGPTLVGRLFAEFVGTFLFMFAGLGIAVYAITLTGLNDPLLAGLAWGIPLFALVAVIGPISGAHFNPAITLGLWIGGRFPGRDVALYIVAQVVGAIGAGALVTYFTGAFDGIGNTAVSEPSAGYVMSFVSIGYGEHSPQGVGMLAAALIEFIATGILVAVVLGATSKRAPKAQAPAAIGLTIAVLVMLAGPLTRAGLNPARATASAIFGSATDPTTGDMNYWPLQQLWLWWVVTLVAGAFVGLLYRGFGPVEDLEAIGDPEAVDA